jgi:hypothetical protein
MNSKDDLQREKAIRLFLSQLPLEQAERSHEAREGHHVFRGSERAVRKKEIFAVAIGRGGFDWQ